MKKLLSIMLAVTLVLAICSCAYADSIIGTATRYCADCKKNTLQNRVKQDLNDGIFYPEYQACDKGTSGCRIKIMAYRYTWQCTSCGEDTYNDNIVEVRKHTNSKCPGYK